MFVTMILARIRAYLRYRATVRELASLSDHELNDIGLARRDIETVARGA